MQKTCFVICPISKPGDRTNQRSRDLLEKVIRPAVKRFGFEPKEFLEPEYGREIRKVMNEWIQKAEVCIADLTGDNPNVFFEYGQRLTTGRPVLAFIQKDSILPFDVSDYDTATYDLAEPEEAQRVIEKFLIQKGFEMRLVRVDAERHSQSHYVLEYVKRSPVDRIYILQFSLLAISREMIEAWRRGPVKVVILLMHPEYTEHYAGREGHVGNIRAAEGLVRGLSDSPRNKHRGATVGLWYYRHEPSVAAVIIGEEFLQLGWYFREMEEGLGDVPLVKGHDQPSLILERGEAKKLRPKIQQHFNEVWRPAELVCIEGPEKDALRKEWEGLREHATD